MRFRYGAMSTGEILDRSLKLFFSRLGTFYAINLIVQSPLIAVKLFAPALVHAVGDDERATIIVAVLGLILLMALMFIGMAAVMKVVEQEHIDQKIGVGESLGFALTRFLPLILVTIIYYLVVYVGLLLCIVPGIIFACMYALAGQAVVLERVGPLAGMTRSAQLTQDWRGRIFGIGALIVLMYLVLGVGLELGLNAVLPQVEVVRDNDGFPRVQLNETNRIIHVIVETLLSILISTYAAVCLTLVYFDLRTRKEGFDLELAAKGLPQAERPRRARFDDEEDYDDDRPRRRRDEEEDYDDDRPRRRRDEDDRDEDDRPPRRRPRDDDDRDEDDRPPRRRGD